MKDEELEKLSLDSFDEDEFMLNDKPEELLSLEDDIIDTPSEKDFMEELEVMEEVTPIEEVKEKKVVKIEESKPEEVSETRTSRANKTKKEKKTKKVKQDKKDKKAKKTKKSGFKFPKDKKGRVIYVIQAIFCLASVIFIIGCCFFYGSRLIKYYKIYNPKTESGESIALLGSTIVNDSPYATEGEGMYRLGGASVFKGANVNNYVFFGNQMWRIIAINTDGSVDITTDSYINALSFDTTGTTFDKSNLSKYLNDVFLKTLNTDYLAYTSYCLDEVEDVAAITCTNAVSENYVRLIGITEFLNSQVDNTTYLSSDDGYWMYNTSQTGAWHTSGTSLANATYTESYYVKPVVRLKNSVQLLGGEGSLENPYYVEKEDQELEVGNYVLLGEDTWIIYETDDKTVSLALEKNLNSTYRFSTTSNKFDPSATNSLASYLNITYLESLTYKDILNDKKWYIGSYDNDYENIYKSDVTAKVGIYNVADLKIHSAEDIFYLLTPSDTGYVYVYDAGINRSRITLSRPVKPTININKLSIESGKGTKEDPYVLGV